jgi:membrane protein required for beta-lactamase induction
MINEKLRKLFHITQIREMSNEKLLKRRKEIKQSSWLLLAIGCFYLLLFFWLSGFIPDIWSKFTMLSLGIALFVLQLGASHMCDLDLLEIKTEIRIRELEQKLREK